MKTITLTRITPLVLATLSLAALIFVDIEIATRYNQAGGKTRALFGIVELLEFQYKYFILIPAALSILLTIRLVWTGKFKIWEYGNVNYWTFIHSGYGDTFVEIDD